jgi:hypothetical protein
LNIFHREELNIPELIHYHRKNCGTIKMGYYSSLIQRKFKDMVGTRYQDVIREYSEFLLTEELMRVPEVRKILIPLDIFVKDIPDDLYEVLSAYDAEITLAYITDSQVYSIIQETLTDELANEFLTKKERYGHELLDTLTKELQQLGFTVHQRLFTGHKGEDVEKMAVDFDLIALSKSYGSGPTEHYPISPLAIRISQHVKKLTMLY